MSNDYSTFARRMEMLRMIPEEPSPPVSTRAIWEKLNPHFPCHKRTVERDLVELSQHYAYYCSEQGRGQTWRFLKGRKELAPTSTAVIALGYLQARPYLQQVLPAEVYQGIEPQFAEAEAVLQRHGSHLSAWPERVRVLPGLKQLQKPAFNHQVWVTLTQALLLGKQFTALYAKRTADHPKTLRFSPLGLVSKGNVHYLIATANDYTNPVIFALHRISNAELSDDSIDEHIHFNIDEYIANFGWTPAGEITLKADIAPAIAQRLEETPLGDEQKITPLDGSDWYQLEARVPDDQETKWWVYGLNHHIRVTAPPHWVDEFRENSYKMMALYQQ
ncbi:helix-turn-helix transcriptional regulator [Candidatus Thalassolituus haligoni]|uniref:helix-turn-helix transcriptional regulator n=1 Tax=Candidatus Thalassolituus haligoni TaxID=3100113 RepID=UPI003518EEA1